MALQKRVSELPAVTTVAGTDLLIVSSNSATKRTSVQQIGAYFAANGVAGPQGPVGPAGAPGATNYTQLTNVPSTFPPSAHGHTIADVSGLQAALDGKQASGSYATLVGGKVPESQLPPIVTTWEGLTGKPSTFPPSAHSHAIGDVTGLQTALDGKQAAGSYAAATHGHSISDVTGLQTALDGKQAAGSYAAAVHTHGISDVTGLQTALDGKAAASHGHAIADVTGLQTALDGKQASGSYAAASHSHAISDVTGLQTALDGKSGVSHTHSASQVTEGQFDVARIPSLPASQIGSGSLALARLPIVLEQTATVGNSGTSTTLALTTGSVQTVTLSGNCTFTMPAATAGASITLILTQGGTFTATFTGVLWAGGTAPTITATSSKVDILVFVSNGTSWFGTASQNH
jgi:hypothetical protein